MQTVDRRRFLAQLGMLTAFPTILQADPVSTPSPSTSGADEWARLDALAQAELVRKKEVSARELVQAAINRVEKLDGKLNSVVLKLYDRALNAASGKIPDGPFTGVPTLIKDMEPIRFTRQTYGSNYFKTFVAPFGNEFIDRIDRAGFISIGKTNMPELGLMPTTEPRLFGPTRNPWNTDYSVGGSSGGSAAAVAAGLVPLAQAGDGGGSIRIPASCCGLFGLKVSRGRNPLGGGSTGIDVSTRHCLSRSVRDSAAFLDATQGALPGDRYSIPNATTPFLREAETPPGKLRIGLISEDMLGRKPHPDCLAAVQDAGKLCEELGHIVEPVSWPVKGKKFEDAFLLIFSGMAGSAVEKIKQVVGAPPIREAFEPFTWWLIDLGSKHTAAEFVSAWELMDDAAAAMGRVMRKYDILLTPVMGRGPMRIGELSPDRPVEELIPKISECIAYTGISNTTGQPAMSVPLYWNAEGLPIGSQFIGRFADEATLFRLAGQLEKARPWAKRYPPLFA